jgi:hypothetical protein
VLCVAVLLRPLQFTLVQVLEGYWTSGSRLRVLEALLIERHRRRQAEAKARQNASFPSARTGLDLAAVVARAHNVDRVTRMREQAAATLSGYPLNLEHTMPSRLGNVLRRTEQIAGERYGLSTVDTYPRLYQHLSPRLESEVGNQMDALDSTATFVVLFTAQTLVSLPLLYRLDWWSLTPVVCAILGAVAYSGAVRAAAKFGNLIEVAFDLHRFDMVEAMRLPLPRTPKQEHQQNTLISRFFQLSLKAGDIRPPAQWRYVHLDRSAEDALRAGVGTGTGGKPEDGGGKPDDGGGKPEDGGRRPEDSVPDDAPTDPSE